MGRRDLIEVRGRYRIDEQAWHWSPCRICSHYGELQDPVLTEDETVIYPNQAGPSERRHNHPMRRLVPVEQVERDIRQLTTEAHRLGQEYPEERGRLDEITSRLSDVVADTSLAQARMMFLIADALYQIDMAAGQGVPLADTPGQ